MVRIAYKFRFYPTTDQRSLLTKTFGSVRFIYNTLFSDSEKHYQETGKHRITTPAQYKKQFPWLKEVDSLSLCNVWINLRAAYANFFRNLKKGIRGPSKKNPFGFPRYKSKKDNHRSYTTNNIPNSKDTIRIENGKLRLPKIGFVDVIFHRKVEGKIKNVTVSLTPSGKYFVSILTERGITPPIFKYKKNHMVLGMDMSFSNFVVLSNGEKTNPPRWYYETEEKIGRLNRRLHRKKEGSENREKARKKLARVYERMDFQRNDFLHKLSHRLVQDYDVFALEDINLSAMSRSLNFGKTVSSLAFGEFRRMLEYKSEWRGKLVWYAPKFFPSSQLCSVCGYKNRATKDLSVRDWVCPSCSTKHDRDVNAAKNLEKECRSTLASKGINAWGDSVSTRKPSLRANRVAEPRKVTEIDSVSLCRSAR